MMSVDARRHAAENIIMRVLRETGDHSSVTGAASCEWRRSGHNDEAMCVGWIGWDRRWDFRSTNINWISSLIF